ncbi:MAG: high frequency lysogenization protein HflD [Pseudomonadota bacterium]
MSGSLEYQKRALALAGIVQAVHLVSSIARTGMVSQDSLEASLRSIFVTNPGSISEVYKGTEGVRLGIKLLGELLGQFDLEQHRDLVRYSLAVMKLERTLSARPALARDLGARIARVDDKGLMEVSADTVSALALVYEDTLSLVEPRIIISGQQRYLQGGQNIERIRALLLAAVRSAVLWHQVGGRRWQLLLARKKLLESLKYLN